MAAATVEAVLEGVWAVVVRAVVVRVEGTVVEARRRATPTSVQPGGGEG